jgi:hypothetical protein
MKALQPYGFGRSTASIQFNGSVSGLSICCLARKVERSGRRIQSGAPPVPVIVPEMTLQGIA